MFVWSFTCCASVKVDNNDISLFHFDLIQIEQCVNNVPCVPCWEPGSDKNQVSKSLLWFVRGFTSQLLHGKLTLYWFWYMHIYVCVSSILYTEYVYTEIQYARQAYVYLLIHSDTHTYTHKLHTFTCKLYIFMVHAHYTSINNEYDPCMIIVYIMI